MIQFFNNLNKTKTILLSANILLVFFLILLNNLKVIPLRTGDFIFFAILTLAFALYRPGWAFLFFIGSVALENINLAPESFGINVRPYQFFGALTIVAIFFRFASKRLYFEILKPKWNDYLLIGLAGAGFLSVLNASDKLTSLKFSLILATFSALYFLVKNYVQNSEDLKRVLPFFLSSATVVMIYGIWQNVRFRRSLNGFEAMPGRPNATFTEPEWLGIFVIVVVSAIFGMIYYYLQNASFSKDAPISNQFLIHKFFNYFLLILSFILLIITVSRSAWLGALAAYAVFILIFFTDLKFGNWQWKETVKVKLKILASFGLAIAAVFIFHLTNFQLFNRVQSTSTGMQKITISCQGDVTKIPSEITSTDELKKYNCRHINLEEIEAEKTKNNIILEIYRQDPNVNIRSEIYQKSWREIKNNPVLGIGWGNISHVLGTDGRGTPLNSSNIFLEVWLGSGILGLACFVAFIVYILFRAVKNFFYASVPTQKAIDLFIISSWFGLVVFNMFNGGLFLGFFWVWLAVANLENS